MARLTTVLAIGSTLALVSTLAAAKTPAAVCRLQCKPRIAEQCPGLAGRPLRGCRRPLVRACKATTPAIACATTEGLTRELGDHAVRDGAGATLTLCADGSFTQAEPPAGGSGGGVLIPSPTTGTWQVAVANGGLELELQEGTAANGSLGPIPLAHDAGGALLVDGAAATLGDATAACRPALPPSAPAPVDVARVVDLVRAVTDRTLGLDAPNGIADERREIQLCASGRAVDTTITSGASPSTVAVRATWTIEATGSSLQLVLQEDGGPQELGIDHDEEDGSITLNDQAVDQRDARASCDDLDLQDRLTAALGGRAFFFTTSVGPIPIRNHLGLCDSGRFVLVTTATRHGSWHVEVSGGVATLVLEIEGGLQPVSPPHLTTGFDAAGAVTVQGQSPLADPGSLVTDACQG
jgi:hypothetical protein